MTSVRENEEKSNTIQPPLLCFSHLQLASGPLVLLRTLNSVTVQDLRKTYMLVNHLFLALVVIIMLFLMITVIGKLIQEKFQSLMEILKSSPGGKPTSTVISWA